MKELWFQQDISTCGPDYALIDFLNKTLGKRTRELKPFYHFQFGYGNSTLMTHTATNIEIRHC